MRCLPVALGLVASISGAFAADLPTLRGSDAFVPADAACCPRWGGFYVGGQVGYGFATLDFSTSTRDLVAHALRQLTLEAVQQVSTWQVLGKVDTRGASAGFFVGYNIPWESVILGFDLNYSRTHFFATAPVAPLFINTSAGGNNFNVNLTGSASIRITDMATVRARAGFEYGNFMPYGMIGVAVARADLARSATVSGQQNPTPPPNPNPCDPFATPPCIPFLFTESHAKSGAFIFGWSVGGGLEVMMMPKVFLRAEYEFVGFPPVFGITALVQTARLGAGLKF